LDAATVVGVATDASATPARAHRPRRV